jgi:Cu2+-exporting ATPase
MSDMIPNNPLMKIMDASKWNWVQLILSLPVVFYACWMFSFAYKSITWNQYVYLIGIGSELFCLVWLDYFSCYFSG